MTAKVIENIETACSGMNCLEAEDATEMSSSTSLLISRKLLYVCSTSPSGSIVQHMKLIRIDIRYEMKCRQFQVTTILLLT